MAAIQVKVASVSRNTNAFGLRGHVLVSRTGLAWEAGANELNTRKRGDVLTVVDENFALLGFEIPRSLGVAPRKVVGEVWG